MLRQRISLRDLYRLTQNISKRLIAPQRTNTIIRSNHYNVTQNIRNLSTAAHQYEAPVEHAQQFDDVQVQSIDVSLAKIDDDAKNLGRVLGRDVASIFDSIKKLGKASSIQSLYLIRCCGALMRDETPTKRTELLHDIWSKIKELQIPIDVSHYNALLKAYLENDFEFSPANFLAEMERDGVEANRVSYQRLIDKYCDKGDLSGASAVLQHMKDKDMPVNEAIFNSLVKGHVKQGDFDGTINMFDVMRKSQLSPSAITYSVLACGFAQSGNIEAVMSTFNQAQRDGLFLPNKIYFSVIYELAIAGHGAHIDQVFQCITDVLASRQDCVNLMYDLMNKGLIDLSFDIVKNVGYLMDFQNGIAHFLRQLVFLHAPVKKIIECCKELKDRGLNDFSLHQCVKFAFQESNIGLGMELIKEMEKQGMSLRTHYFWPIFAIHGKNPNLQEKLKGISETLSSMCELGLLVDVDTYHGYVLPYINTQDPEFVFKFIENAGQSQDLVIDPLFRYYCDCNEFGLALKLCRDYNHSCGWELLFKILIKQYKEDTNPKDVIQMIQYMCKNKNARVKSMAISEKEVFGKFFHVLSLEQNLPRSLLVESHRMGIEIPHYYVREICKNVKRYDAEAAQIVQKMQRGSAVRETSRFPERELHPRDMSLASLENQLTDLMESGESTRTTLRHMLVEYCKLRNIDKVREVKELLDNQGFVYTPPLYAILIDVFVTINDIDKAEKLMNKMQEEYPGVKVDVLKALSYVGLLVRCNRHEDAIACLHSQLEEIHFGQKDLLLKAIKRVLNISADTGNVELTKTVFDFFESKLNITEPKFLLDCLVKVHLQRNDIESAIREYDRCLHKYKFGPARNILFKKCITSKDFERLQKVADLTAAYNGKISTLHELAFSFIECNQVQQAYKVFQNLSVRTEMGYLLDLSMRFVKENKDSMLEDLLVATRDLTHIDKDRLYYSLLTLHAQNNEFKKALGVWDTMQEESIQPSTNTLRLLGSILEKNGQPIPFVVPSEKTDSFYKKNVEFMDSHDILPNVTSELMNCLQNTGDHIAVLDILSSMKKGHIRSLSTEDLSSIVELLLKQDSIKALCNNVQMMSYILEKARVIFKPLLEKYAEAGDVRMIKQIMGFLPDFTLKSVTINYFFNKAYATSGQHEQLLTALEMQVGKDLKLFSVVGFLALLDEAPQLEQRAIDLVNLYKKVEHFDIPTKALWVHYFITERQDKAEEILKRCPELFTNMDMCVTQVLKAIRFTKNVNLGRSFIDFVNKYEMKLIIKNRAYSNLMDILVDKSELEAAVALFEEGQKHEVTSNRYNRSTLLNLKSALEEKNIPVPFQVSMQDDSSSSSSSDSD